MTEEQQPQPRRPRSLQRFHGGLVLVPERTALERELTSAAIPKQVVLPLHQHFGTPALPVVRVGQRVLRGQTIARPDGFVSAAVHASTSGRVTAIEPRPVPNPDGADAPCIVIDSDGDDYPAEPPEPLPDFHETSPADLRVRVRESGIVGLGGAVFPTSVKLTARADMHLGLLILNGAECEPYISCDEMLMRTRAARIVTGARIMLHILQVHECVIAVEADKAQAADAMQAAIALAADERITLVRVPPIYPEGGERQLIEVLTGREVPFDGLPMDIGCVCHNVGTAAAVADAVIDGQPLISRVVTVTGPGVREPRNVLVRIGTPVSELIALAGGYDEQVSRLVMGGAMMGFALATDEVPIVKASNCILALRGEQLRAVDDAMPCIRCGECARVCPARLLPQQLHWHIRADALGEAHALSLFDCIECGSCDLVCPSHIPLTHSFRVAKAELWLLEREHQSRELARRRFESREERLGRERSEREARRAARAVSTATPAAVEDDAPGNTENDRQRVIRDAVERSRAKRREREQG